MSSAPKRATDIYTGNGGADVYDYTYAVGAMDRDTITDFDADDVIDISFNNATQNGGGLLANQFIGAAASAESPANIAISRAAGRRLCRSTPMATWSPTRR